MGQGIDLLGSRDQSIDALRVGALLVRGALHASVPYLSSPVPELWPVRQGPGSWIVDLHGVSVYELGARE